MTFVVFTLISSLLGTVDKAELERLVARNEQTLYGIHTLRGTVNIKQSQDEGKTWRKIEVTQVVRSGQREILYNRLYGAFYGDIWREGDTRSCMIIGPSESRMLTGYEGEQPPESPLEGEAVDKVKGSFSAMPDYGAAGWVNKWKTQAMLLPNGVSLRDLLKTYTPQSIEKRTDPAGETVWEVDLRPNSPSAVHSVQLTFSPNHGYLISKQVTHLDYQGKSWTASLAIRDYWDLGSGLWMPKFIESTMSKTPGLLYAAEIVGLEVNQAIDEGVFKLDFPENAIVSDYRNQKYSVWGKGSPARTFESTDAFNDWNRGRQGKFYSAFRKRPNDTSVALGVASIAVVALLGVILYRRKISRISL